MIDFGESFLYFTVQSDLVLSAYLEKEDTNKGNCSITTLKEETKSGQLFFNKIFSLN